MVENLDGCSIGTTFVPSVLNNNLVRGWDLNGFYLIDMFITFGTIIKLHSIHIYIYIYHQQVALLAS